MKNAFLKRYLNGQRPLYNAAKSETFAEQHRTFGLAGELPQVISYVKNQFLGFAIPYVKDGKDKNYFTDFIVQCHGKDGTIKNLMVEISGFSNDKAEKKWFVENRWIPAVNSLKDKYEYPEWHFIEIANDIRNIKNQLIDKISSI